MTIPHPDLAVGDKVLFRQPDGRPNPFDGYAVVTGYDAVNRMVIWQSPYNAAHCGIGPARRFCRVAQWCDPPRRPLSAERMIELAHDGEIPALERAAARLADQSAERRAALARYYEDTIDWARAWVSRIDTTMEVEIIRDCCAALDALYGEREGGMTRDGIKTAITA